MRTSTGTTRPTARRRTVAGLLLALVAPLTPAALAEGGGDDDLGIASVREEPPGQEGRSERSRSAHADALYSVESDCYEFNESRATNLALARAHFPARYDVFQFRPGVANGVFVDYVCERLSIDGTPPRRTIVSMLAVQLVRPAGYAGPPPFGIAWHGSDNPLLVNRLRQLGVPSEFIPLSTSTSVDLPDGRRQYDQEFRGSGLDYTRRFVVARPTGAPKPSGSALFLAPTPAGDVTFTYDNLARPAVVGNYTQTFAADSLPARLGIRSVSARASYTEGSWEGTYARRDALWPAA